MDSAAASVLRHIKEQKKMEGLYLRVEMHWRSVNGLCECVLAAHINTWAEKVTLMGLWRE